MSGSLLALCIDPPLRRLLVRPLADLVRLGACPGDLAKVFANRGADLPAILEGHVHRTSASGLALSVAKGALAPQRCFTGVEAETWLSAHRALRS